MKKILSIFLWMAVALVGAWAYVTLAVRRDEPINSIYILVAALCAYAIGYRFYSKWLAARVLLLNDRRATPCEVHEDGRDYVKTNKWIVFGHHFAAISGPGPLVGPVLAAQFGYLPGALWILVGVVLGGAVQDFVILFCSMRRNGKSLGQMVKEELNTTAGAIGVAAILAIMIILLAVLALVVVKALAESPWGVFTVGATIPIALFMGNYLRSWRVGKVLEVSVLGVVLLLLAVWGGQFVHNHQSWARVFTRKEIDLAWAIIIYGLAASILPVWLLLAPRDYLSTFMKLGTIFALVVGVFLVLPDLQMPAISTFVDGSGLVVAGKLFPFCFITIACGAISGFHTLISSGITPKIITRESYARPIGYGAMCLESLVAIMALIAACTLDPGVYLAMNIKGTPQEVETKVEASGMTALNLVEITWMDHQSNGGQFRTSAANASASVRELRRQFAATGTNLVSIAFGYQEGPVTVSFEAMAILAAGVGEKSLYGRTGGAATLAVGMAQIFSKFTHGRWLDLWYHFAIMFEALFILTTLDAGTRVGRYLLQDVLGNLWKPLGETRNLAANVLTSALVVSGWGYFLIQGVRDPLGGINSLWPLFGIANQLLASIALCLATTVILKMQLAQSPPGKGQIPRTADAQNSMTDGQGFNVGRPVFALVSLVPLVWLLSVTMTAGVQKIFHADPRIGFLAQDRVLDEKYPALRKAAEEAPAAQKAEAEKAVRNNRTLQFNNRLDAAVAGLFLVLVVLIVSLSAGTWILLLARRRLPALRESAAVWLPEYATAEGRPFKLFNLLALAIGLAKELSGEAGLERAERSAQACPCGCAAKVNLLGEGSNQPSPSIKARLYQEVVERRFDGVKRCC